MLLQRAREEEGNTRTGTEAATGPPHPTPPSSPTPTRTPGEQTNTNQPDVSPLNRFWLKIYLSLYGCSGTVKGSDGGGVGGKILGNSIGATSNKSHLQLQAQVWITTYKACVLNMEAIIPPSLSLDFASFDLV